MATIFCSEHKYVSRYITENDEVLLMKAHGQVFIFSVVIFVLGCLNCISKRDPGG